MKTLPSVLELGCLVQAWVRSQGRSSAALSREMGYASAYLTRAFGGQLPLRVRTVFEVLARLGTDPHPFFDAHYPLGGEPGRLLGGLATGPSAETRFPAVDEELRLARQLAKRRKRKPHAVARRAGQLLAELIRREGRTQRQISLALGLSETALGQALRGGSELTFFHVFGVLEQLEISPALYFAELFLVADGGERRGLDAVRLSRLLASLERALLALSRNLCERRPSPPASPRRRGRPPSRPGPSTASGA